jgi:N-acetylglucosaminyldiphosphoundecaprenol N-acetyl-beta-D-mannosaminyltransferase
MLKFCEIAACKGYKQFFYGGAVGVPQKLQEALTERFPGLQVVGAYSPPFRPLTPEEDQNVVRMINESGADVVWVGLGAPKQEWWMAKHLGQITAPVMVGVGAAFDFHTGRVRQAPPWMQERGLEWLYRLYREPRRLWKRYLMSNSLFVWYLLLEKIGLKRWE